MKPPKIKEKVDESGLGLVHIRWGGGKKHNKH